MYTPYVAATIEDRIGYLQKAARLSHEIKDTESEIALLTNSGYLYAGTNRLSDAYAAFLNALKLEGSIGFPFRHYTRIVEYATGV